MALGPPGNTILNRWAQNNEEISGMPDLMIVYSMTRALYREATRASNTKEYSSYPVFMRRYNELRDLLVKQIPNSSLLPNKLSWTEPMLVASTKWPELLNNVMICISQMIAFLEEALAPYLDHSLEYNENVLETIVVDIDQKLRPTIRGKPEREEDIQDAIENLLIIKDYEYEREKTSFAFATTSRKPDFTFKSLKTALEVKLCNSEKDEKSIIEEICSDMTTYKTEYPNLVFVVYDVGIIRDQTKFKIGFEKDNPTVRIVIVKH
jgi:hypothetical protein